MSGTIAQHWKRRRSSAIARRAGGFSLLEMMVVLMLVAVFATIISKVFIASILMGEKAAQSTDRLARWELLTQRLREDVWSAHAMNKQQDTVEITQLDGRLVRWEFHVGGSSIRRIVTINGKVTEEIEVPSPVASLRVEVNDDARELSLLASEGVNNTMERSREQRLSFVNQARLANRPGDER